MVDKELIRAYEDFSKTYCYLESVFIIFVLMTWTWFLVDGTDYWMVFVIAFILMGGWIYWTKQRLSKLDKKVRMKLGLPECTCRIGVE